MNAIAQGYIQDAKFVILDSVARDNSPTFAQRISNFFDSLSKSSHEAWERSGKTEIL
jgi:hypothetical protein